MYRWEWRVVNFNMFKKEKIEDKEKYETKKEQKKNATTK